jgi:two-component system chemotaxis sensor kinase CheA
MTGIDERLAHQIDRILEAGSLSGTHAKSSETLHGLSATVSEYLEKSAATDVREAAGKVADLSHRGVSGALEVESFRAALISLQRALNEQRERDAAGAELANDPELVQEFLIEAREHLAGVEAGMLTLEREPDNAEALNGVFRSFHTVKGLAGFLGATAIHELAHETENVLDLARSGTLAITPEIIDLVLKSADALNKCLDAARARPINTLPRCESSLLDAIGRIAHMELVAPDAVSGPQAVEASPYVGPVIAETVNGARSSGENRVVRIETSKLEHLIDMVGELVIAESVVRHHPGIGASKDPLLSRNLAQLARVVQEVQKTSMSMRMVAVGTLFRKMSRLTRDLARRSGKTIELITVGDEVELDRSIVEDLADPMVHMIRNAVDHGLENPADRAAAGKSEKGTIRLQAMHDAGDIVIEITDDGRGMDPARILAKARRLGLVAPGDTPDEETIVKLIFEPGFSTVDKVTDLSGRGVGMDVVNKQIQKLRGRIAIRSTLGKGCAFVLRLPLTLAIIDGLVVGVGSQRFILPMFAVREMFSPKPNTFVTLENRAEAALFRDKLLPLIRLSRLFEGREEDRADGVLIVVLCVVNGRDQLYCVAVDQLIGKQEVVIKSLGKTYRDVPAISGGAILGDGRVGLIIDVNSLRYQS